MKIRTFIGLTDFVDEDEKVNDFLETVEAVSVQMSATGKESITVTVVYKEANNE